MTGTCPRNWLEEMAARKRRRKADPAEQEAFEACQRTSIGHRAPDCEPGAAAARPRRVVSYARRRAGVEPPAPALPPAPPDPKLSLWDCLGWALAWQAGLVWLCGLLCASAAPTSELATSILIGGHVVAVALLVVVAVAATMSGRRTPKGG